jgi:hypothetical protein
VPCWEAAPDLDPQPVPVSRSAACQHCRATRPARSASPWLLAHCAITLGAIPTAARSLSVKGSVLPRPPSPTGKSRSAPC